MSMSKAVLRAPTIEDHARIRVWQSDDELHRLAPVIGDTVPYKDYAIDIAGNLIGYCSIYNVTLEEAELGIVISDRDYWGKGYGAEIMNQLAEFCFNHLGVKRVHLRVLSSNVRAIKCYQKCGFSRYGALALDGSSFILMEARHPS